MSRLGALLLAVTAVGGGCGLLLGLDEFVDAPPDAGTGCGLAETTACYSGPPETESVGICQAGTMTCGADGVWSDCSNEVLPANEDDCFTAADENCDGLACGDVVWSSRFGDPSNQTVLAVEAVPQGGLLVAGMFEGTIALDPLDPITAIDQIDGFVFKLDTHGNPVWRKAIAGPNNQSIGSLAVDEQGSVFIAGTNEGTAEFGDGCPALPAGMFVAKLDRDGKCLWSRRYSGSGQVAARIADQPRDGEIVIAGTTRVSLDMGGQTLPNSGEGDVFVAKLDAANGDRIWAKIYGDAADQSCAGVTLDANGSVIITGTFTGTLDLAESGGTSALTSFDASKDLFVAKIQPSGAPSWSKSYGQSGDQIGAAIAVDSLNNIILTGAYSVGLDFGESTDPLYAADESHDTFVAKIGSGGAPIWSRGFGGADSQQATCIDIDDNDNIIVGGAFDGEISFGGPALVSPDNGAGFLVKLTRDGEHVWSNAFGHREFTVTSALSVGAPPTHVSAAVNSNGAVNFGDGELVSTGSNDIFIARFAL